MNLSKRGVHVVLALILLVFSSAVFGQVEGCYFYPKGSEDLYCVPATSQAEAQQDCANAKSKGCVLDQYFKPNSNCKEIPECVQVTCSADCLNHALGKCQQLGGMEVKDAENSYWCSLGCCKVGQTCSFNYLRAQCVDLAKKLGTTLDSPGNVFDNSASMTVNVCQQKYCGGIVEPGTIKGTVTDSEGKAVAGVSITFEGIALQTTTDNNGKYQVNANPGTFIVKTSKEGYLPASASAAVQSSLSVQRDFTLVKAEAAATVFGSAQDSGGKALPASTISWKGPLTGITLTNVSGGYKIPNLVAGTYEFTATKAGYAPSTLSLTLTPGEKKQDFTVAPLAAAGFQGKAYLDINYNGKADDGEEQYDVNIYVDGKFKAKSKYPGGSFFVPFTIVQDSEEHELSAAYQGFEAEPAQISIKKGQTASNLVLLLQKYVGECSFGQADQQKNVEQFSVGHVAGEKQARLSWSKPCPEVSGFVVDKTDVGKGAAYTNWKTFSPAENTFIDEEVEWGQTYQYAIRAMYADVETRFSTDGNIQEMTLGEKDCEHQYDANTGWKRFCSVDDPATPDDERKLIWTCAAGNKKVLAQSCATLDVADKAAFFCAETAAGATCKDSGPCALGSNPFGLYYQRETCYGKDYANYCYLDFTDTIFDQCRSCTDVNSCFGYKSKDACEVNNCLGTACNWIDGAHTNSTQDQQVVDYGKILPELVTIETGKGYCVEADYAHEDFCNLCGKDATLFENYYCTPEICSGLGRCFSTPELASCEACGEHSSPVANCYTYGTDLECTQGQAVAKSANSGQFTFSNDRCGWKRCLWIGAKKGPGSCVKDGDGDSFDDCLGFQAGEQASCHADTDTPHTVLLEHGLITLANPTLAFTAQDESNPLGVFAFCVSNAEPDAPDTCVGSSFNEEKYPGVQQEEQITLDLLKSVAESINGKTYRLSFYSQDKYRNQEELQQTFVFIDNVLPQFTINGTWNTEEKTTALKILLLNQNDPMSCQFTLTPLVPKGDVQIVSKSLTDEKAASFASTAIVATLNVSCADNHGNVNSQSETYTFDVEKRIEIVSPELYGTVESQSILFSMRTLMAASCSLYNQLNEKVADFEATGEGEEQGTVHNTPEIGGFVQGEYAGKYLAVCHGASDPALVYEDYFQFTVDFLPPATKIILTEGKHTEEPLAFDWESYFVRSATVQLDCIDDGFACEETFYCLGEGCDLISSQNYETYLDPFTVNKTVRLCYYSTDTAGHAPYQPMCGDIIIDGYGIRLENPPLHYYQDEMWGVSQELNFDVLLTTKVPTSECKFDLFSAFDYANVPAIRKLQKTASGHVLSNFPGQFTSAYVESGGVKTIYVQCAGGEGELGPEQKINLEYDPTGPKILSAAASPNPVLEGIKTTLKVTTDDKTVCKYSDNSDGDGQQEYGLMEFGFFGTDKNKLDIVHEDTFTLSFAGFLKNYSLNVLCRNGAGDISGLSQINFTVDYTQAGNIYSLWPNGQFFKTTDLTAQVITTKNALCQYQLNDSYIDMKGQGSTTHTVDFKALKEKYYQIPVRCTMADQAVEGTLSFTIDKTPPQITQVDDGNYTCGNKGLTVFVQTNEGNISSYSYKVFDLGNETISSKANVSLAAAKEGTASTSPFSVTDPELMEGHKYKVDVVATDAAGNTGTSKPSDGILATAEDYLLCEKDKSAPNLQFISNQSSCKGVAVEITCTDESGCQQLKYGTASSASSCKPTSAYTSKILVGEATVICYSVSDVVGKFINGSTTVQVEDDDGDGIMEHCDECPYTDAGEVVDDTGCATGELSDEEKKRDTDGDLLPDSWEKAFTKENCVFNHLRKDSDENGIEDAAEDYDKDSVSNFDEYGAGSDPCTAEVKKEVKEEKKTLLPPALEEKTDFLPLILLMIGFLMTAGGVGYLVYYYRYAPKQSMRKAGVPMATATKAAAAPGLIDMWKQRLAELMKARLLRAKEREREAVFGQFTKESARIPHLEDILKKKAAHLPKLQELAEKYVEHREEIRPGLKPEEKGIFTRLEKIAQQTQEKGISDVATKEEAQDIFKKLKDLAVKRKK
ncbi:carboxypeptidase regulatory-like domain-containing protein [Candidatus Woesearchaeota archaeon]|nr:carboxypeptidase regulatory-like domain-containing protein [Candidatus Woesearchaeota archaeon]